jgi:hypothetical protein
MVPEPNDDPKPDDDEEIDDESDEEPDEESDDKPNDELDDHPDTLYVGERLMDGPIVLQPDSTPAARRSGHRRPRGGRLRCTRLPRPRCSDVLGHRKYVSREASTLKRLPPRGGEY